ncbi:MAG: hypothetical protein WAV76_02575 [Bacteroidota bacterium]
MNIFSLQTQFSRGHAHLFRLVFIMLAVVSFGSVNMFSNVPVFSGKTDVGKVLIPGSVEFDSLNGAIRMTGNGENIWGSRDAFYFVWNKIDGDISCTADIAWEGKGVNPHRKAGWMVRVGLEPDDPYIDAVLHGDGLLSMQYRKTKGDGTNEVQFPIKGALKIQLDRTGDQFTFYVSGKDGIVHPVGTVTLGFSGTLYAGLFVCSHDSTVKESAVFSDVQFSSKGFVPDDKRIVESTLETMNIETGVRTIVRQAKEHFEAPNWSRDGKTIIYNSGGKIYALPAAGGQPLLINTGFAAKCNNDHGISWDGKQLAISNHAEDGKSLIYLLPIEGGTPKLITKQGPSYWHGWSPDNKTLAYCAERNGQFNVYTISAAGGEEKQLTSAPGLNDGPEYSPDGKYIYFNSVRTSQMKIWRMNADGAEQIQFTPNDEFCDWFAHVSPDNKQIVFVSYDKNVEGHPANKNVLLRAMPVTGGEIKVLAKLFGGQGTMNVPSWSPDSKQFSFVSYRLVMP